MHVKLLQSYLTLCNPVDHSPPGYFHGILQARILERVAIPFSKGSSLIRFVVSFHLFEVFVCPYLSLAVLANTQFTQLTSSSYLQCVCVCTVTQLCLTLCDPMDCRPPGSSVHGILQARVLEWVAMPFSRGSFQPRDQTHVSCVSCFAGGFFTHCAIVLFGFHDTLSCSFL